MLPPLNFIITDLCCKKKVNSYYLVVGECESHFMYFVVWISSMQLLHSFIAAINVGIVLPLCNRGQPQTSDIEISGITIIKYIYLIL